MKKIYTLLLVLMITSLGFGQTTIYTQDFETNLSGYSHTPSQTPATDAGDQYFHRAEPSDGTIYESGGPYTNVTGSWLFVGSNPKTFNSGVSGELSFGSIDVTGYSDLVFSADFGGVPNDWDATDELSVEYSWDNSTWDVLYSFSSPVTNDPLELENNAIGGVNTANGAVLTYALQTITSDNFTGSGTTLYLKIVCNSNANYEAFGVDNIILEGTSGGGCTAPTTQATAYNSTSIGTTSATLNWTDGDGDEVLVLVKEGSAVDTDPTDGTAYSGSTAFTSGDQIGTGNYVVQSGSASSSVSVTGLTAATTYHVAVYEYNTTDTCYLTPALTGSFTTGCSIPTDVSTFTVSAGNTEVDLSWTNGSCFDEILVVAKATSAVTETPSGDGTAYTADAAFASGTDLGTGEYAVYKGTGTSVTVTGLTNGTTYHFEAFARKVSTWSAGVTDSATPDAPTFGWQITSEDTSFVIDFDTTVSGVNEGAFDGSGFTNSPASGQLNSDAWESTGLSDGALNYGGSETSGDHARGSSTGGVTSGGFYAFDTGGSNYSLGTQGTGSDFTPGTVTLRAQNQTGNTVTVADLEYLIYVYNDQGRASTFNFSYSTDDITYSDVGALDFTSEEVADGSPAWASNSKSTSITGLSIADGDFLYLRWSSDDAGGSGSRDEFGLDDIDLTFNPVPPTTYTFSGTWSPSDPNGASTSSEFIVIASGDATIDTNTTCDSVTVNAGAGLTVDTGITLTVSNDLTLESSSTTYSSLILDGSVSGTINYERHVNINGSGTTGSNDLISAPLTGQAFSAFATANPNILSNGAGTLFLFGPFDKTTGAYLTYADTESATLDAGVGYRAASDDNSTFTFTGTANNVTVTNDIINSGPSEPAESEWNLVGNPYPSYINVQDFLNHEVSTGVSNLNLFETGTAAIYGYDGNALNGWTVYNLANTTASTVIAPGQGFFVSADATNVTAYDLEFTPAMRSTGTTDDFISGRNAELLYVKVNASTNNNSYTTDFYFNMNASEGFDLGYDAEIWGESTPDFAIYSHLVQDNQGKSMALQALSVTDLNDVTIPLGVNANQGEQLTFSITEINVPPSIKVYLEDIIANTFTLLNNGDYTITPTTDLSGTGRFFLRTSNESLSTVENSLDTLNIFALSSSKELVVSGQLQENASLELYDIQGRKVLSSQLDSTGIENRFDTSNLSAGVYVVTVENIGEQKTQKVILK